MYWEDIIGVTHTVLCLRSLILVRTLKGDRFSSAYIRRAIVKTSGTRKDRSTNKQYWIVKWIRAQIRLSI